MLTRWYYTGIIIYVNNFPITWFGNQENNVETSSFGYEFIVLNITTNMIKYLRHKLRIFLVPIDVPADVFCDNKTVVTNSSVTKSFLSENLNSICYHKVQKAQTAGTIRIGWIEGEYNKYYISTKIKISTKRRHELIGTIFNE